MSSLSLSKSDFLEFRQCAKSFWLKKKKPEAISWPAPTLFYRLLMEDGYAVERVVKSFVADWPDRESIRFQVDFSSAEGLFAKADMVRFLEDRRIELFEIKASTSLKSSGGSDHIDDAAFQTLVAEKGGFTVDRVYVVHLNKEYERMETLDAGELLVFREVTDEVRSRIDMIEKESSSALSLLALEDIDEDGCSCVLIGSSANHCPAFQHFNPQVPDTSIYLLPRISKKKLELFVDEQRFDLDDIDASEVTASQAAVLEAAQSRAPVVNQEVIGMFLQGLDWPLHFYDYETFSSAIPISKGHKPQQAVPVQFSHHLLREDGRLEHFEYLCEDFGQQKELLQSLAASFESSGTVVAWYKSFEITCNNTWPA